MTPAEPWFLSSNPSPGVRGSKMDKFSDVCVCVCVCVCVYLPSAPTRKPTYSSTPLPTVRPTARPTTMRYQTVRMAAHLIQLRFASPTKSSTKIHSGGRGQYHWAAWCKVSPKRMLSILFTGLVVDWVLCSPEILPVSLS